jgi:LacI family transcriptional regulator
VEVTVHGKTRLGSDVNQNRKVTLKDIAELTGFSVNTVSHALRGLDDVSESTKEKILKTAHQLGYVPNMLASSMRSGRTKTIAVVVPDIVDPLFAIWCRYIEEELHKIDYDTLIINTDENYEKEEYAINLALSKKVEGIIICPVQKKFEDIQQLKRFNIPFVLIGRHFKDLTTDYVIMDDFKGSYIATQYLLDKGRKKILFLSANEYISSAEERLGGYREALITNGLEINESLIRKVDLIKNDDCQRVLTELIGDKVTFNACLAFSDLVAWQMIYFLNQEGFKVPEDIAVVGFDNLQSTLYYPYSLTSVTYSKKMVVEEGIKILIDKIENGNFSKPKQKVISTSLFVGESA